MTWTYLPSLLTSSGVTATLHKTRRLIGDVDTTRQQLSDEEIYWCVSSTNSATESAAAASDLLAAHYAFLCNTDNGELRISAAARHKHYQDLADRLRKGGAGDVPGDGLTQLATMYVGGQSRSAVRNLDADSDNVPPTFAIGQDDNPDGDTSSTSASSAGF